MAKDSVIFGHCRAFNEWNGQPVKREHQDWTIIPGNYDSMGMSSQYPLLSPRSIFITLCFLYICAGRSALCLIEVTEKACSV